MPIYTYRARPGQPGCEHCRRDFDVTQKMADERLTACPECGSEVQRIIVGAAVVSGLRFGEKMTNERLKAGGLKRLVKGDDGNYVDDTPK